jgi:hypothetical protein
MVHRLSHFSEQPPFYAEVDSFRDQREIETLD